MTLWVGTFKQKKMKMLVSFFKKRLVLYYKILLNYVN